MSSEKEKTKKEEDKKKQLSNYITTKLYGVPFVNNQGYKIGNYIVLINKDKLPFSSTDQVDHFLFNLFAYVKNVGAPQDKQVPIDEFFKNDKDFFSFMPIKYLTKEEEEEKKRKEEDEQKVKYKSVFETAAAVAKDRKNQEKKQKANEEIASRSINDIDGGAKKRKNKRKTKAKKSKKRRTRKSRK
uniref:Uncharacterized protein n=1 Tax=viral metagenome TaxID=1070528 RepID=A0A6C0JG91_9ZZZZ